MPSEQYLQKQMVKYLDSLGAWTVVTIQSSKRGTPDILACLDGKFIAIEVKAAGKMSTVTEIQRYQLKNINAAGGIAIACDSLEALKNELTQS